ncbi:hypothetical protein ABFY48_06755 [Lysinibacillus pakistanensis]|uniref:hypothetical protein n=1 Tax=Lysinibacillus pakistanensis TaxID=759811 RepID=UPI003D2ABA2D
MTIKRVRNYHYQWLFNKKIQIYIIIFSFIFAVIALWFVPEKIPIHFNALQHTDISITKYMGVFIFPTLMTSSYLIRQWHWQTYFLFLFYSPSTINLAGNIKIVNKVFFVTLLTI